MRIASLSILALLISVPTVSQADFDGRIKNIANLTPKPSTVVAVAKDGTILDRAAIDQTTGAFEVDGSGSYSLFVIDENGQLAGELIATCSPLLQAAGCKLSATKVGVGFKDGAPGKISFRSKDGYFHTTLKTLVKFAGVNQKMRANATARVPEGSAENLGVPTTASISTKANNKNPADGDFDGLVDAIDADIDNDTVLNPYDTQNNNPTTSVASATDTIVRLFSNLKLSIDQSLNANTGTIPTSSEIDTRLSTQGTLAIPVLGDSGVGDTTELDCGGLNYCKAGGTGQSSSQNFPDDFDGDADGKGTITPGSTGDFQLNHGATSSEIQAGDVVIEEVTNGSTTELVPGLLNFVFHTTPALKTLSVDGGATFNVTYPATAGMEGSADNCFDLGSSDTVTITAWRPQRPGNSALGEAAFVDIGKSKYTIDIPNLPCSVGTSGSCSVSGGPGNCTVSAYTESDANLSIGSDGIDDAASDAGADSANTFTFTVDIGTCLGSTTFSAGEKVFLDLQARSEYGDNAAQKFCVKKTS